MKFLKIGLPILLISIIALFILIPVQTEESYDMDNPTQDEDLLIKGARLFTEYRYDEAFNCFSISATLAIINNDSIAEMQSRIGMGDCLYNIGAVDSCINLYKEAILLAKNLKKTINEYDLYSKLRQAYAVKADRQSIQLITQIIDSIASISNNNTIAIDVQLRLAGEAALLHDTRMVEHYLLRAESLLDSLPPIDGLSVPIKFNVYKNLRDYYLANQVFDSADIYSNKCIEMWRTAFNQYKQMYDIYGQEAIICAQLGKSREAYDALDSLKYGLNLKKDNDSTLVGRYYEIEGSVNAIFRKWKRAINSYKKSLHNYVWMIDRIRVNKQLSNVFIQKKDYVGAKACYMDLEYYCGYLFGKNSFEYADALWGLANMEGFCGENELGKQHYMESVDILMQLVSDQIKYVSVQERDAFWLSVAPRMWAMTAYALKIEEWQSVFTEKCYETLLFSKGFLLESDRELAVVIKEKGTPEEQEVFYEMINLQNQLKGLVNDYEHNKEKIDVLHKRISEQNKLLTPIVSKLGYTSFLEQNYNEIKQMLQEDEVLLDFTDFVSDEMLHQHVAYVVDCAETYPKLVKGFSEETVVQLLDGKAINSLYEKELSDNVLNVLWKPFEDEVKGKNVVYYVPSGMLHQITLESIPLDDGTYLGDHYKFIRLTSAREIARLKQEKHLVSNNDAVLYGGLKYDVDIKTMENEASTYKVDPISSNERGGPLVVGNGKFAELPNSKEEIDKIGAILKRHHIRVTPRTGIQGTEESFMAMSGKAPGVLHIATHGFYYTPERVRNDTYLRGYNDAMMLSGLIMSGGNMAWSGIKPSEGVMNGVMTANLVAAMDLKGTDLLVLSACQTGLGLPTPEGLFGLQRAFKKAGVQTMIMTLWNIKDDVAKEFMIKFYENLTDNGWDKRKAFEAAKYYIRQDSRYSSPYYWAGFVMLD